MPRTSIIQLVLHITLSPMNFYSGETFLERMDCPRSSGCLGEDLTPVYIPTHSSTFRKLEQNERDRALKKRNFEKLRDQSHYDLSARTSKPLRLGDEVRTQDPHSIFWNRVGIIQSI